MKKIILLNSFALISLFASAQKPELAGPVAKEPKTNTFELQLKGSANSTWLLNKNVSDSGDELDYAMGWGFN